MSKAPHHCDSMPRNIGCVQCHHLYEQLRQEKQHTRELEKKVQTLEKQLREYLGGDEER